MLTPVTKAVAPLRLNLLDDMFGASPHRYPPARRSTRWRRCQQQDEGSGSSCFSRTPALSGESVLDLSRGVRFLARCVGTSRTLVVLIRFEREVTNSRMTPIVGDGCDPHEPPAFHLTRSLSKSAGIGGDNTLRSTSGPPHFVNEYGLPSDIFQSSSRYSLSAR
jgi:hypothetical protein